MMRAAKALFLRDWRLATRAGGGAALSAMFFLILVAVTPFAMGPDQRTLAKGVTATRMRKNIADNAAPPPARVARRQSRRNRAFAARIMPLAPE